MTDSQKLLIEYAHSGSEAAFHELVARYIDLVYSTAVRLMDGDRHLAQDVAQTVFADFSRQAQKLSNEVMIGGWLHRHTCYIASSVRRSERRRQARERQAAVEMNAQQNHSEINLAGIGPILDEAINRLAEKDRAAILLRFFEQRDFHSIGRALGSSEDAAQKRVSRALGKLHSMLKHKGVVLSATALGTALAGEAVAAAPAGLAITISTTILTGTAGTGTTLTLMKLMTLTKIKAGLLGIMVVGGTAASLVAIQHNRENSRNQNELLHRQSDQIAQISADNQRLSNLLINTNGGNPDGQLKELTSLRNEANSLRAQTNDLARLQVQNQRLRRAAEPPPETPLQLKEQTAAKVDFAKCWLLAFRIYANDHNRMFPTSYEQASAIFKENFHNHDSSIDVSTNEFDLVYQGTAEMAKPDEVIVLRQKKPWLNNAGRWVKIYGMADGSVQQIGMPSHWKANGEEVNYDNFEAYEKDHIVESPRP
jgi:RNA polymerase sigma factor (sigma-70 family)